MSRALSRSGIKELAKNHGFSDCQITHARLDSYVGDNLEAFLAADHHGTMEWMAETKHRRSSPQAMWAAANSAIILAMNYGPKSDPIEITKEKQCGTISVYAKNRDYHDVMKGRLKLIAQQIAVRNSCDVKVFVDTAPLMEKPLAAQAGLGWQGKHTNLVSRELGSWFFLGVILTDLAIEPDSPESDHCGSCRACLDACPTGAFPAPYKIDARRCISYLTIEHKGPIDPELRPLIGNRIYGCDDCLAVCPWNKFARSANEAKLIARQDLESPKLSELVQLNDAEFRKFFSGSPIKRIGRDRFIRNVLLAIGNSNDRQLSEYAKERLDDPCPLVRGAAIWALSQLLERSEMSILGKAYATKEQEPGVLGEWRHAMIKERKQP